MSEHQGVFDRRGFLKSTALGYAACGLPAALSAAAERAAGMRFGLVTYLWGQHMELPDLISKCEQSGLLGVELRTQHRHGVEPSLSAEERKAVRK